MSYAQLTDIQARCRRSLTADEQTLCGTLIDDAAVIIDAYNSSAGTSAKKLVTCNMIIRALGDENASAVPIGATQGSVSALGYSQSWTISNGSAREMYLTKLDKKILGGGNKLAFVSPYEEG